MHIALAMIFLLLACLATAGCGSQPRPGPSILMSKQERLLTAEKLAADAEEAMLDGDTSEAYQLYLRSVNAYPAYHPAWNNLGVLVMNEDSYLEAYDAFSRASAQETLDPRYEYNLGLIFYNRHRLQTAHAHFLAALERDPNYLNALRGAIATAVELRLVEPVVLEWIARAQMLETNQEWLAYYQTHRLRIERQLEDI